VLADRVDNALLGIGLALLVLADLVLARVGGMPGLWLGLAWGLHMGMSQGLLATLVADAASGGIARHRVRRVQPRRRRGAARRSMIAGALWQRLRFGDGFLAGAGFAALALLATLVLSLSFLRRQSPDRERRRCGRRGPTVAARSIARCTA
jgi:hypothetical protein